MGRDKVVNIVAIDCMPEVEQKFIHWYDDIHIPLLMKFKGLIGVKRYKLTGGGAYPRHLGIYEFENQAAFDAYEKSPELATAKAESNETWKQDRFEVKWRAQYEFLRSWVRED